MVEAAVRQSTSSATGVAAGSNAAAKSPATPAAAGGNPPVQAMGNGAVQADVEVTKAAERFAAKEAEDLRREREEAAPTRHHPPSPSSFIQC